VERQKVFTLKDREGLSLLTLIIENISMRAIPLDASVIMTTFFLQMEEIRNDFPISQFAEVFSISKFNLITLAFKHHIKFGQLKKGRLANTCKRLMEFLQVTKGEFLCRNKKEVNLLNTIHDVVMEEFMSCITQQLIFKTITIVEYMYLNRITKIHCWSSGDVEQYRHDKRVLTTISEEQLKILNTIKHDTSYIISNDKKETLKMSSPKSLKINENISQMDGCDTYKFNEKTKPSTNIASSGLEHKKCAFKDVNYTTSMKDVHRNLPYLYNRIAVGYINILDETIIPKNTSIFNDKNNRIFTNSVNKCYYRNGKKIGCRVQECKDGVHVIVEAEKSYGAALLMVRKSDVNFDKFLLTIDFNTATRIYHTPTNIAKVIDLI